MAAAAAAAAPPRPQRRVILHLDADCFFVQVHLLRDASLRPPRPVAVQQHDDVIAINYPAKALGVKKHMAPHKAKRLLEAAGGRLVHVPDEGTPPRTSYRIYREASESVEDTVRAAIDGRGAGFEKGHGMDEWFVDATRECEGSLELGAELAVALRQRVRERAGITVSVGVARNKFVAKLVASMHKPDGLTVAFPTGSRLPRASPQPPFSCSGGSSSGGSSNAGDEYGGGGGGGGSWPAEARAVDAEEAVRDASVRKLPGLGSASTHSRTLEANGLATIGQLQDLGAEGVARVLCVPHDKGAALWQLAMGIDDSAVVDRQPQSMVEQMSLATEEIGHIRTVTVGSDGAAARLMEMGACIAHRTARHLARHAQAPTTLTLGASAARSGEVRQKANKGAAVQQAKQCSCPMPMPPSNATADAVGRLACRLLQRVSDAQGWHPGGDFILNKLALTASAMEHHGASRSQPSVSSHFAAAASTSSAAAAAAASAAPAAAAAGASAVGAAGAETQATAAPAIAGGSRKRRRHADGDSSSNGGSDNAGASAAAAAAAAAASAAAAVVVDVSALESWLESRVRRSTLWGMATPRAAG